jgi:CheY-like chemotaxis protein
VTPEIETFPLQDVIDRIVAEHADGRVKATPTPVQVRSDSVLLERLLRNLVGNAVKHGGGVARVETRVVGEEVEIAVADNGPGIAPEDQERIFEEFVRVDKTASANGLGLGLAIVKRIADLLDMPLELHSAPGQGARFVVRPPLANAMQPPSHRAGDSNASLAGASVLVMDDDALAREAIAGALRDLGANVRVCNDESSANALLAGGMRPSLLVMDFRIDGELLGIDIANRLRERIAPAPQVIMITGDTGPDTLERLRASGHAWLIKPVSPRDLREAAAQQLLEA